MKHLWEADHSYYINEGNYYDRAGCHTEFATWGEFLSSWAEADPDYNWFVRWDWREGDEWDLAEYNGDDYYRHAKFVMQIIGQRKSLLQSIAVYVCRADEPEIIKFLEPYWEYMKAMWSPLASSSK